MGRHASGSNIFSWREDCAESNVQVIHSTALAALAKKISHDFRMPSPCNQTFGGCYWARRSLYCKGILSYISPHAEHNELVLGISQVCYAGQIWLHLYDFLKKSSLCRVSYLWISFWTRCSLLHSTNEVLQLLPPSPTINHPYRVPCPHLSDFLPFQRAHRCLLSDVEPNVATCKSTLVL